MPLIFSRVYVRNNHLDISSHQHHEYGRRFSVQSWGASVRISLVLVRGSSARVGMESGDLHSKPSSAFWKHWGLSLNCLFWALVSLLVERDCKRASTSQDCFKTNNLKSLVQCLAQRPCGASAYNDCHEFRIRQPWLFSDTCLWPFFRTVRLW